MTVSWCLAMSSWTISNNQLGLHVAETANPSVDVDIGLLRDVQTSWSRGAVTARPRLSVSAHSWTKVTPLDLQLGVVSTTPTLEIKSVRRVTGRNGSRS